MMFSQNVSGSFPSGVKAPQPGDHDAPPSVVAPPSLPPYIPRPPSTWSTAPVTNPASSEHRKRTAPATSSGSPSRPSGVVGQNRLLQLVRKPVGQLGIDVAGRNRVDAHAPASELLCEGVRETDDAGLGGRVVRLPRIPVDPDDTRHVDDRPAPPLEHPARHRAARVEDAAQVRLDHPVPVLVAHADDECVPCDAGVVDENVDRAELALDTLDEGGDLRILPDVRLEATPPISLRDDFGCLPATPVVHRHPGSGCGELARDGSTDSHAHRLSREPPFRRAGRTLQTSSTSSSSASPAGR